MRPAVYSLMSVVFSLTTGEFVIAGILPEVAEGLSVSVSTAGTLVTAYAVGMIVGGPVVTVLTARVARKPLVAGLVVFAVLANLGSAIAPNYPVLLAMRAAAGLVVATFFAVAIATAVATAEAGREAAAVARVALGMNLGIVLGTPIGAVIGQSLGWRATFVAVALSAAIALPLVIRFMPEQPGAVDGSVLGELRVFGDREVWWAIALTALGNIGVVTVFTFIAPLLTDISGFATSTVPVLLLVYGVGAIIGNQVGGRLADRALLPSVAGLLAALACALLLFWLIGGDRTGAAVLTFVIGALAFAIIPGMQTRVVAAAAVAPTLAVAVNASGFQLAAACAGRLGGEVIGDGSGLRSIPLAGAVLTVAGATLAVWLAWRERTRGAAPARAVENR
ncbi:DHA1 family inner membrane transport protein [Nocardia tenerifensis]|uniref:DHA1 family inner membrane transport protein n=1 Tax=Nocardia tenerifensis TaxID=228006 RepID=A0A318KDP5_9NOCA|nr:MFS transporter [Nocardia tenerifensis]PXX69199.1 DHA1 family inner membrane transport protein [Nocardia tenerifensis]